MPDRPRTFQYRDQPKRAKAGGSTARRDRTAAYQRLRERLLGGHPLCAYCLATGLIEGATVIDHIVALSLGGSNQEDNLISSCRACNDNKSKCERSFLDRGYDGQDIMLDADLGRWVMIGRTAVEKRHRNK